MRTPLTRRSFVGAAVATGTAALLPRLALALPAVDARVEALRAFSRDPAGGVHLVDAAFLSARSTTGTLRLSAEEAAFLRRALLPRDAAGLAALQAHGLRAEGHRYVFVGLSDDGAMLHAVRAGGTLLTARRHGALVLVATSNPDMAHGRAVEALRAYTLTHSVA